MLFKFPQSGNVLGF